MLDSMGVADLTYCYSYKQRFDKGIILGQQTKHVGIIGDVDEDSEGIFSYRLSILNQYLFVRLLRGWRKEAAHRVVLDQQLQIFHRCELGGLENGRLCLRVLKEIFRRWSLVSVIVASWR